MTSSQISFLLTSVNTPKTDDKSSSQLTTVYDETSAWRDAITALIAKNDALDEQRELLSRRVMVLDRENWCLKLNTEF